MECCQIHRIAKTSTAPKRTRCSECGCNMVEMLTGCHDDATGIDFDIFACSSLTCAGQEEVPDARGRRYLALFNPVKTDG